MLSDTTGKIKKKPLQFLIKLQADHNFIKHLSLN